MSPLQSPAIAPNPRAVYQQRLAFFQGQAAQHERRLAWTGNLRFALLVLGFVLTWPTGCAPPPTPPRSTAVKRRCASYATGCRGENGSPSSPPTSRRASTPLA